MQNIIRENSPPMLIFVQNKFRAKELQKELMYEGIPLQAIHSDLPKTVRDEVITKFRKGNLCALICTDLLCRGIDFLKVNTVVNYDFP